MKNILVVGSINMDLTIHTPRVPVIGETITGNKFATSPGGKGSNQAIAIARLGGNVKFLGAVGDDIYGQELIKNFENNNVEFCGKVISGVSTGVAVITVCEGDNSIILDAGANGKVDAEMIKQSEVLFKWADYVVLQAEIPDEANIECAHIAKKYGKKVVFNPAPYHDFPDELYRYVDIFVPNETETELMTGINPIDEAQIKNAVEKIREKGIEDVIITLGERGSCYTIGEEIKMQAAFKVKPLDTTAAGDCFIGAFVKMLAEDKSYQEAAKYASKASSIAVSRYGAANSLPYQAEMNEL